MKFAFSWMKWWRISMAFDVLFMCAIWSSFLRFPGGFAHPFCSFYGHRDVSTFAVDAVRQVRLQTIRKRREIEEVQTHVDQKIPIVCTFDASVNCSRHNFLGLSRQIAVLIKQTLNFVATKWIWSQRLSLSTTIPQLEVQCLLMMHGMLLISARCHFTSSQEITWFNLIQFEIEISSRVHVMPSERC